MWTNVGRTDFSLFFYLLLFGRRRRGCWPEVDFLEERRRRCLFYAPGRSGLRFKNWLQTWTSASGRDVWFWAVSRKNPRENWPEQVWPKADLPQNRPGLSRSNDDGLKRFGPGWSLHISSRPPLHSSLSLKPLSFPPPDVSWVSRVFVGCLGSASGVQLRVVQRGGCPAWP